MNVSGKLNFKDKVKKIWDFFSTYEKIWFFSILTLSIIFAFIFPEEEVNGVNGQIIMILYLLDTFLNVLCELLIAKQSKWNFLESLLVEICEIVLFIVLAYRFASMIITIFFWIPIDIISFINWHRHPDSEDKEVTKVRKLSGLTEVLVVSGIVIWTIGVGYLLTKMTTGTTLFAGKRNIEIWVCYFDACASAVAVANGIFILLRYREQWIAQILEALLEAAINILSGQFVLLILKVGYLTNSIYGYMHWTKYINHKSKDDKDDSFL